MSMNPLSEARASAQGLIQLVTSVAEQDPKAFLGALPRHLARHYVNGLDLQTVPYSALGQSQGDEPVDVGLSTRIYATIDQALATIEPLTSRQRSKLADDLRDVVVDAYKLIGSSSAATTYSGWDARFDFEQHWGRHALDALRVLHGLVLDE